MRNAITLTMAQAVVEFLKSQWVERDGGNHPFFSGMWGIFGHGNLAGLGQALEQDGQFPHYLPRYEQAMVHSVTDPKLKSISDDFEKNRNTTWESWKRQSAGRRLNERGTRC